MDDFKLGPLFKNYKHSVCSCKEQGLIILFVANYVFFVSQFVIIEFLYHILNNAMFGGFNPYQEILKGDWLRKTYGRDHHLGQVYIKGKALYEIDSLSKVFQDVFVPPFQLLY